jgi:rfaE bifunctional protein nucleotidyltransferase chain/domain
MSKMLIALNATRQCGQFMGDQLCYVKTAYVFVENRPKDCDGVILAVSPVNEMDFLWTKFIENPARDGSLPPCEVVCDSFHVGNHEERWSAWDQWRADRKINGIEFKYYRELYLRIHGGQRQRVLCGHERGLNRRNIYEYLFYGQEDKTDGPCAGSDWFDDTLIHHPPLTPEWDVYVSPHCKTQGNQVFTFDYWMRVVRQLVQLGVSVTVGYDDSAGYLFDQDLMGNSLYKRHWGTHRQWMEQLCHHRLVACGNTGTGWLAAACGVPMITMEPRNSVMADHRYRECGLRNIVEVIDGDKLDEFGMDMQAVADYCARRIRDEVRKCVVMTTGCYDILHPGHIRHLEKSRALGTRLVVALNSDLSVKRLKGDARPVNPQAHRKAVLEALRCVDEVRIFDGEDATPLMRELKPNIITNGFGYTPDKIVGRELVESWGGRAVITCTGDATSEPSTTKILAKVKKVRDHDIQSICREASRYSVNSMDKLALLAKELLSVAHLDGDIADLGAYRGGTSLLMRRLAPNKHLHLFDTWQGTPYDDDLCHHKKGEWATSLTDCMNLLVNNDPLITYHEGVFPQSAPLGIGGGGERVYSFVYVDMDVYRSTIDAIDFFWPRLVMGGKLVFDDWEWVPCGGVKKAILEKFSQDQLKIHGPLYTCIVEKR